MHVELNNLRVFSQRLRKRNPKWMKRLIKDVGESFGQCVTLLQEVKTWDHAVIGGKEVLTEEGNDCGGDILLHEIANRRNASWRSFHVAHAVIVSAHLLCVGAQFDACATTYDDGGNTGCRSQLEDEVKEHCTAHCVGRRPEHHVTCKPIAFHRNANSGETTSHRHPKEGGGHGVDCFAGTEGSEHLSCRAW